MSVWLCSFLTRRLLTESLLYSNPPPSRVSSPPSWSVYFCALSNMFEFSNDYNCIGPAAAPSESPGILTWFFIFPGMCFSCSSLLGLVPACCCVCPLCVCVCVVILRPETDLSNSVLSELTTCYSLSHITSDPKQLSSAQLTPLTLPLLCFKLSINCFRLCCKNIIDKLPILFALWLCCCRRCCITSGGGSAIATVVQRSLANVWAHLTGPFFNSTLL